MSRRIVGLGAFAIGGAIGIGLGLRASEGVSCEEAMLPARRHMGLSREEHRVGLAQCEVQGWSREMRACLAAATDRRAVDRCGDMRPPRDELGRPQGFLTWARARERVLDELKLALVKRFPTRFPVGRTGPTPALTACCADEHRQCRTDGPEWREGIWGELGIAVRGPGYFSYEYESDDGATARLRALADFDCDGMTTVYEYACTAGEGDRGAVCERREPDIVD